MLNAKVQKKAPPKLPIYLYEGTNKHGQKVKGEVVANSTALAKAELRKQGILAKKIRKKTISLWKKTSKKITPLDIVTFSRQMATMMTAGIPLVQSFDIVIKALENASVKELVGLIKNDVEAGKTFSEALRKHPKYFNQLYCNLVDAGEISGSLEKMLNNIATYKEKTEALKAKIKKALVYPSAVLVIAFIVTAALLIFVIPQFQSLFSGFGAELPAMTMMIIHLSDFFQHYWYLIFGTIIGVIIGIWQAKQKSPAFAHKLDEFLLKIPIIGVILRKAAIARFARTLAITFAAGLPLVEALRSVAGATGNIVFARATQQISDDIEVGRQLQEAMKSVEIFPPMVLQMVSIGEEAGSLENMLSKVADYYEAEVNTAVENLSTLLEPFIMAFLGVVVGGLVIAMYLPIFKLGSVI